MQAIDVVEVLDRLDAAGIEWWIEGGWGVDALLGRQTREHGDLDLGVILLDGPRVESELSEFRRIETGESPRFLLLEDEHGRRVDLALSADRVRPERAQGRIGGREVRCVPLEVQLNQARSNDVAANPLERPEGAGSARESPRSLASLGSLANAAFGGLELPNVGVYSRASVQSVSAPRG